MIRLAKVCCALAVTLLLVCDVQASIETRYVIYDHPNGNQNPPPYGLRLDNFTGNGGVYTWQFERPDDYVGAWQQAYLDIMTDGTIRIQGNMFGGKTSGDDYVAGQSGLVSIDYTYRTGVTIGAGGDPNRVEVLDDNSNNLVTGNGGTMTDLNGWFNGANGIASSTFDFFDKGRAGDDLSFIFDNDTHRQNDPTLHEGRGWQEGGGTRDFLFTARVLIPEPSTLLIWSSLGFVAVGMRRRTR